MPKQKQLLLPIEGLETLFRGSRSNDAKGPQAKILYLSKFIEKKDFSPQKTKEQREKENLYQHAKKFTSYYKIFG